MKKVEDKRFIVSVKVGEKGQIIVPKEAREMFSIKAGETLMFLGDKKHGMCLVKSDVFYHLLEKGVFR